MLRVVESYVILFNCIIESQFAFFQLQPFTLLLSYVHNIPTIQDVKPQLQIRNKLHKTAPLPPNQNPPSQCTRPLLHLHRIRLLGDLPRRSGRYRRWRRHIPGRIRLVPILRGEDDRADCKPNRGVFQGGQEEGR